MTIRISRRRLLTTAAAGIGAVAMPYLSRATDRPQITHGVQSGDVGTEGGVVWARADRPSQMMVEVATTESFSHARALPPIAALPESDFTAKMLLENLPAGQEIFYRVRFRDLSHIDIASEPVTGRFRTAPADRRDVSFVWGGDVAGQGWGINPDEGGMFMFETMRRHRPDFLLHSGDTIYADGVIAAEVKLADGKVWKNVTVPEKAKVAETLDEFGPNVGHAVPLGYPAYAIVPIPWPDEDGDEDSLGPAIALDALLDVLALQFLDEVAHGFVRPNAVRSDG